MGKKDSQKKTNTKKKKKQKTKANDRSDDSNTKEKDHPKASPKKRRATQPKTQVQTITTTAGGESTATKKRKKQPLLSPRKRCKEQKPQSQPPPQPQPQPQPPPPPQPPPQPQQQQQQEQQPRQPVSITTKRLMFAVVEEYANKLLEISSKLTCHKERYGKVLILMNEARKLHPWITEDQVRSKANRLKKKTSDEATTTTTNGATNTNSTSADAAANIDISNMSKKDIKDLKETLIDEVTKKFKEAKDSLGKGSKLGKGKYKKIHDQVMSLHGCGGMPNFEVPRNLVEKRCRTMVLTKTSKGPTSPASEIEPIVLVHAKHRQEVGNPLKPIEGVKFANSLLEGSTVYEKIKGYQKTIGKENNGKLTGSWWRGFMRRHTEVLAEAKGHRLYTSKLKDVSNHSNVVTMYELLIAASTVGEKSSKVLSSSSTDLDSLKLNFARGPAAEYTQDLIAHLVKEQRIHENYLTRKKEGEIVRDRLTDVMKDTTTTSPGDGAGAGGSVSLFQLRKMLSSAEEGLMALFPEREEMCKKSKANWVVRLVELYDKHMERYGKVIDNGKLEEKYNNEEMTAWLKVRKKKEDGLMPTTATGLKELHNKIKFREVLTLREYLLDEGQSEEIIHLLLDGNNDHNVVAPSTIMEVGYTQEEMDAVAAVVQNQDVIAYHT